LQWIIRAQLDYGLVIVRAGEMLIWLSDDGAIVCECDG
jgi:hypothetical protein